MQRVDASLARQLSVAMADNARLRRVLEDMRNEIDAALKTATEPTTSPLMGGQLSSEEI
jgi:hypothetical protein